MYLKVRSSYTDIKLETRKEPPINIYLLDGLFVVLLGFLALFYEYCYGLFPRGVLMELESEVTSLKFEVAYLKEAHWAEP